MMLSIRAQLLFLAFGFLEAYGQDQAGRLDILKGNDGQSACALKDTVHAACSSSPSPPLSTVHSSNDMKWQLNISGSRIDVTPTPTLCTCNNVFFNIWSACSFASGNNTLPVFNSWAATCTNNSIDLNASALKKDGGMGIDVPAWADIPVPGNTSFDLQEAVVRVRIPQKTWTILQIILPLVSALIGIVLTVLFLNFYQRKRLRVTVPSLPSGITHIIRPGRRVKPLDQRSLSHWEIEPPAPPPSEDRSQPHPSVAIPPSPPDTPHRESTVHGHPSIVSSDTSRHSALRDSTSARDIHPFGREEQERFQRQPLRPTPTDLYSGTGTSTSRTWGSLRDVRLPRMFRKGPVHIVSTEPSDRFRIDGSSEGTASGRGSLAHGSDTGIRMTGLSSVDVIDEIGEDQQSEGYFDMHDDEATNLITEDERRDSALEDYSTGTSNTHGTSINSRIRVESPTASNTSPRSTIQSSIVHGPLRSSLFSKPKHVPPPLPPVPNRPAPLPPPTPARTSPRGLESGSGLRANPVPPNNGRIMASIPEDQNSDRNRSQQESSTNYASSSSMRPTPVRSYSDGSTKSTESSRPLPSPALSSSSLHQRSPSHNEFGGSSGAPHSRGPLPNTPPGYFHPAHTRSGSNNSSSSGPRFSPQDLFDDPFTPNRRGLSVDDTASFYLTADPQPHSRSTTPMSSRPDPAAFFPAAVRGAGYG